MWSVSPASFRRCSTSGRATCRKGVKRVGPCTNDSYKDMARQEELMHSRTIAILDRLEKASWFSRVGIDEGSSAVVVKCWPEAIEHCDSSAWEDLQGEALNQYREFIARHSMERLRLW